MAKVRTIDVHEHVLLDAVVHLEFWLNEVAGFMDNGLIRDYDEELSHTENVMDALETYLELG